MSDLNFDPKLASVMDQIKNLIVNNDLAGAVQLISPTHSAHSVFIEPSWSKMKVEKFEQGRGEAIRLKALQSEDISPTGHMIFSIRDFFVYFGRIFTEVCSNVEKATDVKHRNAFPNEKIH